MQNEFHWIPFYEAFANQLLAFKDKQDELFDMIKQLSSEQKFMRYFHFERDDWWGPRDYHIDPFSVMGIINRRVNNTNRTALAKILSDMFHIEAPVPLGFEGIPILSNMNSFYNGNDEIWNLFEKAILDSTTNEFSAGFIQAFDKARKAKNGLAYITMALFWMRPNSFMPLDDNSQAYIPRRFKISPPSGEYSGNQYVEFLDTLKQKTKTLFPHLTFPDISHAAWVEKGGSTLTDNPVNDQIIPLDMKQTGHGLPKNLILSGPPGTGKTYSAMHYAVAIVENRPFHVIMEEGKGDVFQRYQKYKEEGLIAFITFHQSFGYEEFVEGIRPVLSVDENMEPGNELEYEVCDGVFKAFCDKAGAPVADSESIDLGLGKNPNVWKVSLEGTGDNPTRKECFEKGHIRIGYDSYGEILPDDYKKGDGGRNILNAFYYRMQVGDVIFSCYSNKTIDAIGVVTGEPEWHEEYQHFKRLRKVNWLVTGLNEDIYELNSDKLMMQPAVYRLSISVSDTLQLLRKLKPELFAQYIKIPNRVFIIDEINRGNISKIFGELITLVEPTKRIGEIEQLRATLPYSRQKFGVPDSVYIIGTMNTADRSIARIDVALRRRFVFFEMLPDSGTLEEIYVEELSIAKMLDVINNRITILLDRDHTIGHSYFLQALQENPSIEKLATIFQHEIVPLLQEYFYDDYEKIRLVLGDNQKTEESSQFIHQKAGTAFIFGNADIDYPEYYEVNKEAFRDINAYAFLQ